MFEKITLTNFQSHEATEIVFGDRVTVVHGATDSGKSAVLRALDWVCNNGLDGDYFLSSWLTRGGRCTVTLVADGRTITRERSKTDNLYRLDGDEYKAFGKGVPDAVVSLLNLSSHTFQRQADPPFLIGGTGSEAAGIFNEAAGLSDIDAVESEIRKRKSANDEAVRFAERDIAEAERKAAEAQPWVALRDLLARACDLRTAARAVQAACDEAQSALSRLDALLPAAELAGDPTERLTAMICAMNTAGNFCDDARDALESLDALLPRAELRDDTVTWAEACETALSEARRARSAAAAALSALLTLPQALDLGEPVWPDSTAMAKAFLEYTRLSDLLSEHDRTPAPDTARKAELEEELAQIPVCPECGAAREHWDLKTKGEQDA